MFFQRGHQNRACHRALQFPGGKLDFFEFKHNLPGIRTSSITMAQGEGRKSVNIRWEIIILRLFYTSPSPGPYKNKHTYKGGQTVRGHFSSTS